jgi:hypothetical protein
MGGMSNARSADLTSNAKWAFRKAAHLLPSLSISALIFQAEESAHVVSRRNDFPSFLMKQYQAWNARENSLLRSPFQSRWRGCALDINRNIDRDEGQVIESSGKSENHEGKKIVTRARSHISPNVLMHRT